MESFAEKLARVLRDEVVLAPYDQKWPVMFRDEAAHLLRCLPKDLIRRVEHFGSTAVPGLTAKPIVDVLVEVTDLKATRLQMAPILEAQGYDYFWRPTFGDNGGPFYAWFIKRDQSTADRTHHIHLVEREFAGHWDRLLFRDYLIEHPGVAAEYGRLKDELVSAFANDRVAYTQGKTEFIVEITGKAKEFYGAA